MKVGDYVRTEYGIIGKITKIIDGELDEAYLNFKNMCVYSKNCLGNKGKIIKSSSNIIDLIEVGDYVNGVLVESIYQREKDKLYIHSFDTEIMMCFTNNNIETIITKEQFERMEYNVGE